MTCGLGISCVQLHSIGSDWDRFGLILIGKEVISLQGLSVFTWDPYLGRVWAVFSLNLIFTFSSSSCLST